MKIIKILIISLVVVLNGGCIFPDDFSWNKTVAVNNKNSLNAKLYLKNISKEQDGGFYLSGIGGDNYPVIIKFDSSGESVWFNEIYLSYEIKSIEELENGNLIVVASGKVNNEDKSLILSIDESGNKTFVKKLSAVGKSIKLNELAERLDEKMVSSVGYTEDGETNKKQFLIVNFNEFGEVELDYNSILKIEDYEIELIKEREVKIETNYYKEIEYFVEIEDENIIMRDCEIELRLAE